MGKLLAHLRGASPLGPIFSKELRVTGRRKRTYVLRFFYLGALLLLLLFIHTVFRWESASASVVRRAQQSAEMGAVFFGTFAFFTWFAMALVGPILTSTAVNSERLHKTLAVLLMTPITAWQIVSGKLFSRLLIALTLIGLGLPVLAVVRLLGGVEVEQVFAAICICVATVTMTAALGLLLSTLVSRAFSVILLSYGFMLFIWVFVPTIVAMLMFGVMRTPPGAVQPTVALASVTHPSFALALVVVPDMPPAGTLRWPWCVLFHLALAGAMVLLSAVLLRRMARKENEGVAPQAPAPVGAAAKGEELADHNGGTAAGAGARPPPAPGPPQVSDNPVLWRELRQPLMARRWQARAASLAVLGMLALLYVLLAASGGSRHSPLADPEPQIGFAVIFCALLNLLMCVVSATAIAHEKESDTWALLLATPLSGRQIVWGKLAGLAKRLMWPSVLIVGHFLVFTVFGVINLTTLCIVLWMTFATNVIWLATGLYLSLRLKTVTFAAILNLLLVALLYGGVAIVVGILGAVLAGQENWAEVVGLYAPYAYMGTAIERLNRSGNAVWAHRLWMPLLGQVSWGEFSGWVIKAGCAHLAATALVLWHTIRHFDRIVGRAAQVEAGYGRAGFWQEGRTFGL